jgi:hypothetical protein
MAGVPYTCYDHKQTGRVVETSTHRDIIHLVAFRDTGPVETGGDGLRTPFLGNTYVREQSIAVLCFNQASFWRVRVSRFMSWTRPPPTSPRIIEGCITDCGRPCLRHVAINRAIL